MPITVVKLAHTTSVYNNLVHGRHKSRCLVSHLTMYVTCRRLNLADVYARVRLLKHKTLSVQLSSMFHRYTHYAGDTLGNVYLSPF